MPRNASGVYTLPAGNPVVPGTTIDAAWANNTLNDISNELTNSLSRTGAGGMLAPFRIADGNVTAPGLSFLNETNSGLYRNAAGSLWMAILGTNTLQFSTTAVTVPNTRTFNAQGNALVGGTLGVTGVAAFGSSLVVTGALTATGGVLGNVTAASGTSTFNDVVITGSLDMTAGSSATITGLSTPTNASDAANKGYVDTQDALRLALTGGTMSGAIAMGANKITGLGTPTADTDAANKAYVDSVAQGLDIKASVRAATTGNITLSGAQTIDGVAVIAGDRVLVKNQSSSADNGIYVAAAGAWSRSTDANTWDKLVGAFVFVEDGSTNDNSGWVCAIPPGGTLGVTAVTWEQFSGAGQINAGTGMTKTGNTLNVNTASSSRIVVGADEIDLAQTGVAVGTYKSVTVDLYGRVTAGTNPTTLAGYGISDAYTTTQTDSLLAGKLSLTGGTMSGAIAMGTNRITGMGDPVNAQDAATKNYIDTIFGSTTTAAASAAAAAASASAASTSASNASTSASNASSSASAAATSATNAATSLFNFRAQYLGPLASDPTVDGNGNAVTTGDLYFNTTANETRVYNGTAWVAAYLPAAGYMDLTTNQTAAGVKTFSSNPILSGGTPNGVLFLNGSKVVSSGNGLSFTSSGNLLVGTTVDIAGVRLRVSGGSLVARGAGDISSNSAIGEGALVSNTTGSSNTANGAAALERNTTGSANTANGVQALFSNTTGSLNTANGVNALLNNTTGNDNTANGVSALLNNTTGSANTANGVNALFSNTTGSSNTANGVNALRNNTTGVQNTANGVNALFSNTTGVNNTANGVQALFSNTTGSLNTANGVSALQNNTTGSENTANGVSALFSNTTGSNNTANGRDALLSNTTGVNNTANGLQALRNNTTGIQNTANGVQALLNNTTGNFNTANGVNALLFNTIGDSNTANGLNALRNNTTGNDNTANSAGALFSNTTGSLNTANGRNALLSNTTGINNTANGVEALRNNTTGSNNFAVGVNSGNDAVRTITTQSNEGVLGNNDTVAIYAKVAITVTSDIRDKTEIAPAPLGLSFVNAVNPISYRFRKDRNSDTATGRTILGFSAQELLALQGNTQIVDASDPENLKLNSSDLIAVLFNAVKELSAEVQTLKSKLGE